jgi:hypothetical protein
MTAKKTDEFFALYEQIAKSQRRQQVAVVVILSAVTAVTGLCTWNTWESVAARREANELQRQLIELQRTTPSFKAALPQHSDTRRAVQANAELRRVQTRTHSSEQGSTHSRQTEIESKAPPTENNQPSARNWSVRSAMLDRPGRQ